MNKNILKFVPLVFISVNLHAIDINEAIKHSLLNNNSLKKQQYIYDESKENINLSKSSYKPKFDLSYQYNSRSEDLGDGKDNSNANAVLSYNLFNGFKDKYNIESSKQLADTSKFDYEASKFDLIYSVQEQYIDYLKSVKNIETQNNAFKLLEQQYKDSENRFLQGLLAKNDLLQVNAQMLQSKQDLARAIADSKISRYKLNNILGGNIDRDEKIEDIEKQDNIMLEDYKVEDLDNRSEVRAIKKTIEALRSQKKSNKGNFLPSADLNLAYTKFGDDAFLDRDDSDIDDQESATINLNWNLFNGGKDESQDIIYQKRLLQTKEALEDVKLSIRLQYDRAIEEFNVSQLNFETAKVSLEQSKENYKIVNNRFNEGLSSTTDLINANFLLSSAKQSFDEAYYQRFLAKVAFDRIFENSMY